MLTNYITLEQDRPTRLHFTDHYFVDRLIYDKEFKREKMVRSLVFWVDELDGEPVARTFSVVSERLADQLRPHLDDRKYRDLDFVITKSKAGFLTEYSVKPLLRAAAA